MRWNRVVVVWLLIIAAESVSGALREVFLTPRIGPVMAHQIGVLVGCVVIFAIAWFLLRWMQVITVSRQLVAGLVWVLLTLVFEWALGLALGVPPEAFKADFDPAQGGLMGLGLLFMLCTPALVGSLQGIGRDR